MDICWYPQTVWVPSVYKELKCYGHQVGRSQGSLWAHKWTGWPPQNKDLPGQNAGVQSTEVENSQGKYRAAIQLGH